MHYLVRPLLIIIALIATGLITGVATANSQALNMTVYKSPYCGCCKDWNRHLIDNGFKLKVIEQENMNPIKQQLGIEPRLASCHSAVINGYVIEGHVPANDIKKLLKQKLAVKGLAVPGMVTGSPGMEDPTGKRFTPYQVIAFKDDGKKFIFSSHKKPVGDQEHSGHESH